MLLSVAMLSLDSFAPTRGLTLEEVERFEIRVQDDEVILPVWGKNGVWYERTHRPGGKPKYLSPKGASPHLYNPLGLGPDSPEVWIGEGEFDAISLIVCGAPALGIQGTQSFHPYWALLFGPPTHIVLALDPDDAGQQSASALMELFVGQGNTVSTFDPGLDDINDWLKDDRDGLTKAIREHRRMHGLLGGESEPEKRSRESTGDDGAPRTPVDRGVRAARARRGLAGRAGSDVPADHRG